MLALTAGTMAFAWYAYRRWREFSSELKKRININKHFHAAIDNMSQGLCMFDADQRIIVYNVRFLSLYGLTPEQVKPGTTLRQVIEYRIANGLFVDGSPDEYLAERLGWANSGVRESKIQELSDGRAIAIAFQPMPEGGCVTTHEDVTERRRAEKALMESEARFRAICDHSPVCLNLKDVEGRYLFANKRYEEWWGWSAEKVIGKKADEFQADAFGVKTLTAAEEVVLKTGEAYESEINVKRPQDGQLYNRLLIKFPVKSPDGSIIGLGTVAVDITERKRAEKELIRHRDNLQELVNTATEGLKIKAEELKQSLAKEKELNQQQRQFVSMVSHEYRTPLAVIDGNAQRLKRRADSLTPEDAVDRADKIRAAVERMTQLMESTLAAARMHEGKLKVEFEACDIGKVVSEACAHQQEISPTHVISSDLTGLPKTIQADTSSLEHVFTNLLSNAVKYAPDAPDIAVNAWTEGQRVMISVRDHGFGIDEEELPRIGERFFRAETSTGTAGTGIGLNLAKDLVEMHDGSIKIESRKGDGSTFTVRLPITGPDQSRQVGSKVA